MDDYGRPIQNQNAYAPSQNAYGPNQNAYDQNQNQNPNLNQNQIIYAPAQVAQIGAQAPIQVGYGMNPCGPVDPYYMLTLFPKLEIRELRRMWEAIVGIDMNNKYIVKAPDGRHLFYAEEDSTCCERNCYPRDCGAWRIDIYLLGPGGYKGNDKIPWLHLERPCTCTCLCLNRPFAFVSDSVTGELLGSLGDPFACCDQTFNICDALGTPVIKCIGDCCQLGMCCPAPCGPFQTIDFQVKDYNSGADIASLQKVWECGDFFPICFKEQDHYEIEFGEVSNAKWRALILALAIFLDFRYFTLRNENHHGGGGGFGGDGGGD